MPNDILSSPNELPRILDLLDTAPDGLEPLADAHCTCWHNGLVVIVRVYTPDATPDQPTTGYRAFRWNGSSWDDLDFPSNIGVFASSTDEEGHVISGLLYPQPYGDYMRLASDGTTLWFACLVDETQRSFSLGGDAQPGQSDWWRTSTTYVFAYDESSGWSAVFISPGDVRRDAGAIESGHGFYDHQLGTHEGAGYCYLVSNEAGVAGVTYSGTQIGGGGLFPFVYQKVHAKFIDGLMTAYRITPSGVDEIVEGWNYDDPEWYWLEFEAVDGSSVINGLPPGDFPPISGSANGQDWGRIFAVVTDAGFPVAITNVPSGHPDAHQVLDWTVWDVLGDGTDLVFEAPLSAIRCDTMEQVQASNEIMPTGSTRNVYDHNVDAQGRLWMVTAWDPDPVLNDQAIDLDLFYPEEIDDNVDNADDRNRVRLFTVPADAASNFAPFQDAVSEDVSLAKNPLLTFGPQEYGRDQTVGPFVTSSGNVWLLVHAYDSHGDGLIFAFGYGKCPLTPPEHGRYAWDWARDADGDLLNLAPFFSDAGIVFPAADWFVGPPATLFTAILNETEGRIYVVAWAQASDGGTYLRAWYFPICIGCDKCIQSVHLWQEVG